MQSALLWLLCSHACLVTGRDCVGDDCDDVSLLQFGQHTTDVKANDAFKAAPLPRKNEVSLLADKEAVAIKTDWEETDAVPLKASTIALNQSAASTSEAVSRGPLAMIADVDTVKALHLTSVLGGSEDSSFWLGMTMHKEKPGEHPPSRLALVALLVASCFWIVFSQALPDSTGLVSALGCMLFLAILGFLLDAATANLEIMALRSMFVWVFVLNVVPLIVHAVCSYRFNRKFFAEYRKFIFEATLRQWSLSVWVALATVGSWACTTAGYLVDPVSGGPGFSIAATSSIFLALYFFVAHGIRPSILQMAALFMLVISGTLLGAGGWEHIAAIPYFVIVSILFATEILACKQISGDDMSDDIAVSLRYAILTGMGLVMLAADCACGGTLAPTNVTLSLFACISESLAVYYLQNCFANEDESSITNTVIVSAESAGITFLNTLLLGYKNSWMQILGMTGMIAGVCLAQIGQSEEMEELSRRSSRLSWRSSRMHSARSPNTSNKKERLAVGEAKVSGPSSLSG